MNNKTTQNSIKNYMQNPLEVELHTDFCDNLVSRGYKLEEAIHTTDKVFETLSNKDTYN